MCVMAMQCVNLGIVQWRWKVVESVGKRWKALESVGKRWEAGKWGNSR